MSLKLGRHIRSRYRVEDGRICIKMYTLIWYFVCHSLIQITIEQIGEKWSMYSLCKHGTCEIVSSFALRSIKHRLKICCDLIIFFFFLYSLSLSILIWKLYFLQFCVCMCVCECLHATLPAMLHLFSALFNSAQISSFFLVFFFLLSWQFKKRR